MIINFLEKLKNHKKITTEQKKAEIRGAIIKFYEDEDATTGAVNIPAFMRADSTIKEVIKTDSDIDYYYKKLLKYGWLKRAY